LAGSRIAGAEERGFAESDVPLRDENGSDGWATSARKDRARIVVCKPNSTGEAATAV